MKEEQMQKIISYCDKQLSKKELWNWVCDYLTEEMYWDLEDGEISPNDEQIEGVRIIFNKIIKK
jgi:hypothetical protein